MATLQQIRPQSAETSPGRSELRRSTPSRLVIVLSSVTGLLAAAISVAGLLWRGPGATVQFTTLGGQTVELLGRGLYRSDTVFAAANNLASDAVTLGIAVPLLIVAVRGYARGSLRHHLLLLGVLGYLLYIGASYALGAVAYNELFLVYTTLLAASLYALITTIVAFDSAALRPARLPRWPGWFLIVSAVATFAIWFVEPFTALLAGAPPSGLGAQSTLFTYALDLAVIVPAAATGGLLILRRDARGYVIASSLLVLEALLLPIIAIATVAQLRLGVAFTPGEIVGPVVGFAVLATAAIAAITSIVRRVPPAKAAR